MSPVAASDCAWLFPGQGAQQVGMGRDLWEAYPEARSIFERADKALDRPLSQIIFEGPEDSLRQTVNAQPAILVTSIVCLAIARQVNPHLHQEPAFVAGHSLGEYTALIAAGSLDLEDGIRLVQERGRLMQEAGRANPGSMAAIMGLHEEEVEAVCRETGAEICNINAATQIVIGGSRSAVVRAIDLAKARGARRALPLRVSAAFHSSLMRPVATAMIPDLDRLDLREPDVPLVANVTAEALRSVEAVRDELKRQVAQAVRWQHSVEFMVEHGVRRFLEFGPGMVLTGLVKRIAPQVQPILVNLSDARSIGSDR